LRRAKPYQFDWSHEIVGALGGSEQAKAISFGFLLTRRKSPERQAPLAASASTQPRGPLPPVVCALGKPWMTGLQGLDEFVVAPSFACFRDVRLQQDPRLQQAVRGAASVPDQRCKLFTFVAA